MAKSFWNYVELYGAYLKRGSSQTNNWNKNWRLLGTTNARIHRDYGTTKQGASRSPLWSTIFGVKYADKNDVKHLIASIKSNYELTVDWTGNFYCGISLDWHYVNRWVDISMPGYIKKKMQKYNHVFSTRLQRCPYSPEQKQFGSKSQAPLPTNEPPKLDAKDIKRIQQIVGSILYYARAVDMTVLAALSTIAIDQTKATQWTMDQFIQLLDYLARNLDA